MSCKTFDNINFQSFYSSFKTEMDFAISTFGGGAIFILSYYRIMLNANDHLLAVPFIKK